MKYSIRGKLKTNDGTDIIELVNKFQIWKLDSTKVYYEDSWVLMFEVHLNDEIAKNSLFDQLKQKVNLYNGEIDWHKCYHDEPIQQPCVIEESYMR